MNRGGLVGDGPLELSGGLERLQGVYGRVVCLCLAAAGLAVWGLRNATARPQQAICLFLLQAGDLLHGAAGSRPMFGWDHYYPKSAALARLAAGSDQRAIGLGTLPPCLCEVYGFRDARGYDAVDPLRLTRLLATARDSRDQSPSYAVTQWFVPRIGVSENKLVLPAALDRLAVRHLIVPGRLDIPVEPVLVADGFWVYENPRAGQRAFVPRRVVVADDEQIIDAFSDSVLEADKMAFVNHDLGLPDECRGTASITAESCNTIEIRADLETPGLLVLADLWDAGWRATVNEQPAEVVCVDTAVRGVVLGAGVSHVVFRYEPPRFRLALWVAAVGLTAILAGTALLWRAKPRPSLQASGRTAVESSA